CQDVVRSRFEEAAGSQVSGRRATVWNGGERAEEKKVEERNRAFGGRTRYCCESCPSPPNAERAPRPSFDRGERVPFIEPFSPPPLDPPPPVARSRTPPSPRALFTRVLDVRSVTSRGAGRCGAERDQAGSCASGSRWSKWIATPNVPGLTASMRTMRAPTVVSWPFTLKVTSHGI